MSKWKGLLYMGKDLSDYFLINSKGGSPQINIEIRYVVAQDVQMGDID